MNQTVSREQIVQELWEGTSGSEQSLNNYVARLRKYLSEDESLSLETVPRTGYMLSILGTQPRVYEIASNTLTISTTYIL